MSEYFVWQDFQSTYIFRRLCDFVLDGDFYKALNFVVLPNKRVSLTLFNRFSWLRHIQKPRVNQRVKMVPLRTVNTHAPSAVFAFLAFSYGRRKRSENATSRREFFFNRRKKVAISKENGYVWMGHQCTLYASGFDTIIKFFSYLCGPQHFL